MNKHLYILVLFITLLSYELVIGQPKIEQILILNSNSKVRIVPSQSDSISLNYNQNTIQITVNGDNNYSFRLQGLDATWANAHHQILIHYANLPSGSYVFCVRDAAIETKIKIEIAKTFWLEFWFWPSIFLCIVIAIGVVWYLFFLYRYRQRTNLMHTRNRIAADLHDEVGSNLSSIAILVELLHKKAPAELFPILEKIKANSVESVQLMQDTIWAIQVKNDDFVQFVERMKSFAAEVLAAKNMALEFENGSVTNKLVLPMDQRKNTYLIFKEAINNVAKHSKATKVRVEFKMTEGGLKMTIADNGGGFDPAQIQQGNGLNNFATRAEASEMRLRISSEIGKGTQIELLVPL